MCTFLFHLLSTPYVFQSILIRTSHQSVQLNNIIFQIFFISSYSHENSVPLCSIFTTNHVDPHCQPKNHHCKHSWIPVFQQILKHQEMKILSKATVFRITPFQEDQTLYTIELSFVLITGFAVSWVIHVYSLWFSSF